MDDIGIGLYGCSIFLARLLPTYGLLEIIKINKDKNTYFFFLLNEKIINRIRIMEIGDKNKGKKNFDFLRIPKERPVTFLNRKNGKEDELKKEINSNLNKLSPNNSQKIFNKVIQIYQDNLDCFDGNKKTV